MFTVQVRDEKGRWKQSKYARPMTQEEAQALAEQFDEQGNNARVAPFKR